MRRRFGLWVVMAGSLQGCGPCADETLTRGSARWEALQQPTSLGDVLAGSASTHRVWFRNAGNVDGRLDSAVVRDASLRVVGWEPSGVPPDGKVWVDVEWHPPAPGVLRSQLEVREAGGAAAGAELVGRALSACDDANPCTSDGFDAAAGTCAYRNVEGACDDGSACTVGDVCVAGFCRGRAVSCADEDPCTQDVCDAAEGCLHVAVDCQDDNACTDDVCDPQRGCTHTASSEGTPCGWSGSCVRAGVCSQGVCSGGPEPDGVACQSGDVCAASAQCEAGACVVVSRADCDDADPCTVDQCDGQGGCLHAPALCVAGDPCQTPRCDAVLGCVSDPVEDGTACGAPSACTQGAWCVAGRCVVEPKADGTACDDGWACETPDACVAGECAAGGGLRVLSRWEAWGMGTGLLLRNNRLLVVRAGAMDVAALNHDQGTLLATLTTPLSDGVTYPWVVPVGASDGQADFLLRDDAGQRWRVFRLAGDGAAVELREVAVLPDATDRPAFAAVAQGPLFWDCRSSETSWTRSEVRVRDLMTAQLLGAMEVDGPCGIMVADPTHPRLWLAPAQGGLWGLGLGVAGGLTVQARLHEDQHVTALAVGEGGLAVRLHQEWLGTDELRFHHPGTLHERATLPLVDVLGALVWLRPDLLVQTWSAGNTGGTCSWHVSASGDVTARPCGHGGLMFRNAVDGRVVQANEDGVARVWTLQEATTSWHAVHLQGAASIRALERTGTGLRALSADTVLQWEVQGGVLGPTQEPLPPPPHRMMMATWEEADHTVTRQVPQFSAAGWRLSTDGLWWSQRDGSLAASYVVDSPQMALLGSWYHSKWVAHGTRALRLLPNPPAQLVVLPYTLGAPGDAGTLQPGSPTTLPAVALQDFQVAVDPVRGEALVAVQRADLHVTFHTLDLRDGGAVAWARSVELPGALLALRAENGVRAALVLHAGNLSLHWLEDGPGEGLVTRVHPLVPPDAQPMVFVAADAVVFSSRWGAPALRVDRRVNGAWSTHHVSLAGVTPATVAAVLLEPGTLAVSDGARLDVVRVPCLP